MSDKKYLDGERGMYTSRQSRGTLAGKDLYFGRAWIKRQSKFRYFPLGPDFKKARKAWWAILADPEAALEQRDRPAPTAPRVVPFSALAEDFVRRYKSKGNTGYYGHVAKSWITYFGTADAATITHTRVKGYMQHLIDEEYGDSTVRKYTGAISTLYSWAMLDDHYKDVITANPVVGVRRPQEPDRGVVVLSRDEEPRYLDAADEATRLWSELYLASGMRCGSPAHATEGLGLRWGKINRGTGFIVIDHDGTKNGKSRMIPLNATLTGILARATKHLRSRILRDDIERGRAPDAFVFSDPDGGRLDDDVLGRSIEATMTRAGIAKPQGTRYNLFRHTFGSRLAEAGETMATIAKIMGNTEAVCFKHYLDFSPGHLKGAMAKLDGPVTVAVADPLTKNGEKAAPVTASEVVAG